MHEHRHEGKKDVVPYLTCPTCRFSVSTAAARAPFQNCPRCALREHAQVPMGGEARGPRRFARDAADLTRIAEAKARLTGPLRGGASSA